MNTAHPPVIRDTDTRWLRWGLAAIALLLTVIAVELSVLIGPIIPQAQAQIPDSGAQLQQIINAQTETGRTLREILDHLRSGEIKVTLGSTDKEGRNALTPAPRPIKPIPRPQSAPRTK